MLFMTPQPPDRTESNYHDHITRDSNQMIEVTQTRCYSAIAVVMEDRRRTQTILCQFIIANSPYKHVTYLRVAWHVPGRGGGATGRRERNAPSTTSMALLHP